MKPQPAPARIPESMGPDEIGPYLRSLREKFNLTPQNISDRLHIRVRYITAIEEAKYENMPGKVYARGYVHTYAEFLGLDPEQVVTQCFPSVTALSTSAVTEETATSLVTAKPIPLFAAASKSFAPVTLAKPASGSRTVFIGAVICAVLAGGYALLSGESSSVQEQEVASVAPVPESILESVRGEIMPNAQNYYCLTDAHALSCYFAQDSVRQLEKWQEQAVHPFVADFAAGVVDEEKDSKPSEAAESSNADTASSDSKITVSADVKVPAKAGAEKPVEAKTSETKSDKPDALQMPEAKPSSEADSDDSH